MIDILSYAKIETTLHLLSVVNFISSSPMKPASWLLTAYQLVNYRAFILNKVYA
jgi:hypothetical protein